MNAILTASDAPELGAGARRYELGCAHGVTRAVTLPGPIRYTDDEVAGLLRLRHKLEKSCGCRAMIETGREGDRLGEDAHKAAGVQGSRTHPRLR